MNPKSQGHIEHYFTSILSAVRELEEMFPSGKATRREFLVNKRRLLKLFHKMGSNARKLDWYESKWFGRPHEKFAEFRPAVLTRRKFSHGYFQRCMEETLNDTARMKNLSLLAGESNSKYQTVRDERERERRTLLEEYAAVKQKCWFTLAALGTLLLGISGVITGLGDWLFFVLFIPPLAGSVPICRVVFIPSNRGFVAEKTTTSWNITHIETLWASLRDIDNEIKALKKNRIFWDKNWKRARCAIPVGTAISAIMLVLAIVFVID